MNVRIFSAAAFAAALCTGIAPAAPAPSDARALLAEVRAATLSVPISSVISIHTSGTVDVVGMSGHADEWDDVPVQRFVQTVTGIGPVSGANGWDGLNAWVQDASGMVHVDGGTAGRWQTIDQAYLDTLAYLKPDAGGAVVTATGPTTQNGVTYDVLRVTPAGGSPMDLLIDPKTHLVVRVNATIGIVSTSLTLSDFRRVDGIEMPFKNVETTSTGNNSTTILDNVVVNDPSAMARMAMPTSNVHDFSIAGGNSTTVPIAIVNNHIYVHVMLDGKGPYNFVFDTGGAYIVTPEVAAALNAHNAGGMQLSGVGANTESAAFTQIDSISIGNATIANQGFIVLPIGKGFGVAEGLKIDGMIGYDIPARFLTTIDYANSKLTLAMPGTPLPSLPSAATVPFFFDSTIPRVPIAVDGVQASAQLDTGNRGTLILFTPFLATHPAIAAQATTADGVAGFGVGGPSFAKFGRVSSLQIGPFTLDKVLAEFGTQTTGATADPLTPANIGGGVWNRFTLTLDYPNSRIALAPNVNFTAPFTNDRSGLFLILLGQNVTVLDTRAQTPAVAAGLHKGDVIVSINGKPASAYTLAQVRAMFSQPEGTTYHLEVRSAGGAVHDVTLTLQDYV